MNGKFRGFSFFGPRRDFPPVPIDPSYALSKVWAQHGASKHSRLILGVQYGTSYFDLGGVRKGGF